MLNTNYFGDMSRCISNNIILGLCVCVGVGANMWLCSTYCHSRFFFRRKILKRKHISKYLCGWSSH